MAPRRGAPPHQARGASGRRTRVRAGADGTGEAHAMQRHAQAAPPLAPRQPPGPARRKSSILTLCRCEHRYVIRS